MNLLVLGLCLFSSGATEAMEAFARGELYYISFGRPSAEVVRDDETGILYSSMGCVVREGTWSTWRAGTVSCPRPGRPFQTRECSSP